MYVSHLRSRSLNPVKISLQKCVHRYDTWYIKKKFQVCVNIFCEDSDEGVCEYAELIAKRCKADYEIQIDETLDFCGRYKIKVLNTPALSILSYNKCC